MLTTSITRVSSSSFVPVNFSFIGWLYRRAWRRLNPRRVQARARRIQTLLDRERANRYQVHEETTWGGCAVWIDGEYIGLYNQDRAKMFII
ncbi:MAG: hypothetical protein HDS14_00395 [Bacteroides sp.]|nr:hypothetical protein [Bacteroides sp.]